MNVKSDENKKVKDEKLDRSKFKKEIERKGQYKINKNTLLKIRLVRVALEHSTEVLATNLWEEEGYLTSEFKEL